MVLIIIPFIATSWGKPTSDFQDNLEISQGMVMAANNAKDIQNGNGGAQIAAVHQVKKDTGKQVKRVECFQSGVDV